MIHDSCAPRSASTTSGAPAATSTRSTCPSASASSRPEACSAWPFSTTTLCKRWIGYCRYWIPRAPCSYLVIPFAHHPSDCTPPGRFRRSALANCKQTRRCVRRGGHDVDRSRSEARMALAYHTAGPRGRGNTRLQDKAACDCDADLPPMMHVHMGRCACGKASGATATATVHAGRKASAAAMPSAGLKAVAHFQCDAPWCRLMMTRWQTIHDGSGYGHWPLAAVGCACRMSDGWNPRSHILYQHFCQDACE